MYVINYIKKGIKYKFQITYTTKDKFGLYFDTFIQTWYKEILKNKLNKLRIMEGKSGIYATCESFNFEKDIKEALNISIEKVVFNELF